jgi:CheY-like chemotaxis protein/anti-sigma regulatory factor (Ser/Thr protein kinase)
MMAGFVPFRTVLADDDASTRELLRLALERTGRFDVVGEAADGAEAVDATRQHRPELLLLDLGMPGTSGFDTLARLRKARVSTRVVVVSGYPADRLRAATRTAGAVGYVEKGLSPRRTADEVLAVAGVLDVAVPNRITFARDLRSGGTARRFMEATLERWACEDVLDVVNLLVTELVTNAVVHGGSDADVAVLLEPDGLRVEVADRGAGVIAPRAATDDDTSGRGMALVETMARRWGIEDTEDGKLVWFEVDRPDRVRAAGPTAGSA